MKEKILVIKDIKEIEKYKILDEKAEEKYYKNVKIYDFSKINKVIFKCDVPLGYYNLSSFTGDDKDINETFGDPKHVCLEESPFDAYWFFAKDIIFEKTVGLIRLRAKNAIVLGDAYIHDLIIEQNLECGTLEASFLYAKYIKATSLDVDESITFKTLDAKELLTPKMYYRVNLQNVKCEGYFFDDEE